MAYLTTVPTFDAGSWLTQQAANIRYVMEGVLDVNKLACPTFQLLWNNKRMVELGPEGKVSYNLLRDMYNPRIYYPNGSFVAADIELLTAMEFTTKAFYGAAGTEYREMVRYRRQNRSLFDLIARKTQAMHTGLTHYTNYEIFSNHQESVTAGYVDIESALSASPLPPSLRLEDINNNSQRMMSLPLAARAHTLGHTYGNISSANAFWSSPETNGYTVTKDSSGTYTQDVVTDASATPASLGITNLRTHLAKMQRGAGYRLYCACPSDLYGDIEDFLVSERQRDAASTQEFADLGIDAYFVWNSYNCVFYQDPMMTDLWPNSLFFWDPDSLFYVFDPALAPWIIDWERIQNTPKYSTAVVFDGNLICINRLGVGAMHGWQP